MAIIGAVFGGITGAVLKDEYNERTGKNILENKARSAIRNIQSIEKQLVNIRLWIINFMKRKINKEQKYTLEEIDRHLSTTQMNIQSGFKDWKDMVPELVEEEERFTEITKKQQEVLQVYIEELLKNRKELVVSRDEKRIAELKQKISSLEKQIKDIRKERIHNADSIAIASFSGKHAEPLIMSGYSGSSIITGLGRTCSNCGKALSGGVGGSVGEISNFGIYDSYCEECRKKLFGL